MWPREGSIWKGQNGNNQEEEKDATDASPNVVFIVALISKTHNIQLFIFL
jgi:hypothetical protein